MSTPTTPHLYPNLLRPLQVAHKLLRNRAIMGSMHTGLDGEANHIAKEIAFYAERAKGEIGLIVTGGVTPNPEGMIAQGGGGKLYERKHLDDHKPIADGVHEAGGVILMQVLHSGRYATNPNAVAPSAIRAPINPNTPRAMSDAEIRRTIDDYAACALLAKEAGYDGVEIMGSEGYLINEFTVLRTNQRSDDWGGPAENRHRFPVEIVEKTRAAVGRDFIIMYRISALDLVEGGATQAEILALARKIEAAGADIMNTGIGWHEARVPTIAYHVPRAAWAAAPKRIKQVVSIPVVVSNRINTPEVAERLLAEGSGDMVSMARPLLADPHFMRKAREGRADRINTCIACNQACLDLIFTGKVATCLVNPRACRETEFEDKPAARAKHIAVVGGGAAGMAFAAEAGARGHKVTLFEAAGELGGQLNLARRVPGKSEFDEMLRYFRNALADNGVEVRLGQRASAKELMDYDEVVIAAGIEPRKPAVPGIGHAKVATYTEILSGRKQAGRKVAIIGTGGIGYDVAHTLTHGDGSHNGAAHANGHDAMAEFMTEWAVDPAFAEGGSLAGDPMGERTSPRHVVMLQRSTKRPGSTLGVSTGWVLRGLLKKRNVEQLVGVSYDRIDDQGLHITIDGRPRLIEADTIVVCAGQEPNNGLAKELEVMGRKPWLIGGAKEATELDAMRAVDEGVRLAQRL
jgi:2,4-dienoyl-CoA reductase (NADPH2)